MAIYSINTMSFYRFFPLLVALTFLLEVVNPSTTFVREHFGPVPKQKIAKTGKEVVQNELPPSDLQSSESHDEDTEDYLSSSAVLTSIAFHSQPYGVESAIVLLIDEPPQSLIGSIHRPPSHS